MKKKWDELSLEEQAEMMKVAVKNGIYDLYEIKNKYNEFAEGGDTDTDWSYNSWKRQIKEYMGIRPDEDNTYDYEAYFRKYPEEAWKMLSGDPTAHFSDEFKTVYHPTFSSKSVGNDGSVYSGVVNSETNPQGLVGGTWSPDYHTFTMSSDGYRGPVSMDDRKWYLENAEDNGVQLREADGSLPIYDGIPWGGVLPNVTVYGKKHSMGGPIVEASNKFAEGGEVANEIPMDYQPLVSNTYQPIVDALKTDNTGFNIDDYTYRVQKLHPEVTRDQVQSLYNATPYIASDKVIGTKEGGFRPGDETGYGRRVTLYPNAYTQNTGVKVTPTNANEAIGDTLAHETNHLYTDILLGGSNEVEKDLLFDAYRPGFVVQDPRFNGDYSEERAINAQIRNRISRENGNVIGAELDKAIDNTPDDVLMEMLFDPNNGYINQSGKKHMQDSNGNWNRTDAVRKALKDVALNSYENLLDSNITALGGPIVEMAREYAKGGGIHIKPSHRGRLTALKKRTGKTEAELYNDGNPAHKRMVVFARNARRWKHGLGGNLYDDGGILDWFKGLFSFGNEEKTPEPVYRNRPAEKIIIANSGKKYIAYAPKRVSENNSKTKEQSEKLENSMRATIRMDQTRNRSNPDYDIPYIPEKSIIINGSTTSTNVLDSLAKYAGEHNRNPQLSQKTIRKRSSYTAPRKISMDEMLGLSTQETKNGAMPYFNFEKGQPSYNRALANSNYLTAFGSIPAEYLVRNYQYNDANIDRNTPPLLDAFRYYAQGDYNSNDHNHKSDVIAAGKEAWNNPKVKEWWETSGKYWYNNEKK